MPLHTNPWTNYRSFLPLNHVFLQCGLKANDVWLLLRELWHREGTGHSLGLPGQGLLQGSAAAQMSWKNLRSLRAKQLEPQNARDKLQTLSTAPAPRELGCRHAGTCH